MTAPHEPTPREAHLRTLLAAVLIRLDRLPRDCPSAAEAHREAKRVADLIRAGMDGKGARV